MTDKITETGKPQDNKAQPAPRTETIKPNGDKDVRPTKGGEKVNK